MSKLFTPATWVLKLKVTRQELVDILQLKMVWDNGVLIASQAVFVSIDPEKKGLEFIHTISLAMKLNPYLRGGGGEWNALRCGLQTYNLNERTLKPKHSFSTPSTLTWLPYQSPKLTHAFENTFRQLPCISSPKPGVFFFFFCCFHE